MYASEGSGTACDCCGKVFREHERYKSIAVFDMDASRSGDGWSEVCWKRDICRDCYSRLGLLCRTHGKVIDLN